MISAPASDDEGSTAATDGSTLRTSPAEHGGSVGSESGGSAIDSVAGEHSGGWFQKPNTRFYNGYTSPIVKMLYMLI